MKILLDECIDRRFAKFLKGNSVSTVPQAGWAGIKNGELLARADKIFDIFITVDRNLSFQQHLPRFKIKVIVLQAKGNKLSDLEPLVPRILSKLRESKIPQMIHIR